jgi:hypothetical protein
MLCGDRKIEINVDSIADSIDDVLHKEITSKTGITIEHDMIYKFIIMLIERHNSLERYIINKLNEPLDDI